MRIKVLFIFLLLITPIFCLAQEPIDEPIVAFESETVEVKAKATSILSDEIFDGQRQMIFTAEADGQIYEIDTRGSFLEGLRFNIQEGDKIYLQVVTIDGELDAVYLADVARTPALIWLTVFFALMIIGIGLWRGLASLIGLAITVAILFLLIIPQILSGVDPVLITVVGSIIILAVNMHVAHGFKKGSALAFAATVVGLFAVIVFAKIFVSAAQLTGLASEESALLYYHAQDLIVPKGILLAGIILGAVGVLDDIAINQSEIVSELQKTDSDLSRKELFFKAMRIGRHHIASTVNTLVLAYAGVALPLLLLFLLTQDVSVGRFLNSEPVAEEIVRTLAGTMALILTVPVATWFATFQQKK